LDKDRRIAELEEEIRVLKKIIVELTARLEKTSKNSNNPPSSDGFKKGAPKNLRKPSGRESGGQEGHEGRTLEFTSNPDTIVELAPKEDCDCGGKIVLATDDFVVRQVTDVVPAKVLTVEYRTRSGICGDCGKEHRAGFPEDVKAPVSYGPTIQGLVTYLTMYQLLPLARTTELMRDVFGINIAQGTILAATDVCHQNLEESEKAIKQEIIGSDVAGFDESGMRVNGKLHWLHTAGTKSATAYLIHKNRGTKAMDAMGILPEFAGTAVHDHYKSYYKYDTCAHAECNQHHIRHLMYLHENLNVSWAKGVLEHLLKIKRHVDFSRLFGADKLEQADIDNYTKTYRAILETAAKIDEATPKQAINMAKRLTKFEHETLLFMLDFDVPFTNNLAERDIRMPKLKQKVSGCFRTEDGAAKFARIRGFISTVKKKGKNIMEGITAALQGESKAFLYPSSQ
jgi:transposase